MLNRKVQRDGLGTVRAEATGLGLGQLILCWLTHNMTLTRVEGNGSVGERQVYGFKSGHGHFQLYPRLSLSVLIRKVAKVHPR